MLVNTLFADVSEFQVPVNDSYPYQVLSIRVCDGTYHDHNFARNYAWMRGALSDRRLTFGIVYTYVRPSIWQANANTVRSMITQNGGLDPRVALMLDVESGGNPGGNQSDPINRLWPEPAVADQTRRRPADYRGLRRNPPYSGKLAHQYTNGQGYGGGLPQGCPPFGRCDMNSADGLTAQQFAAACGITAAEGPLVTRGRDGTAQQGARYLSGTTPRRPR